MSELTTLKARLVEIDKAIAARRAAYSKPGTSAAMKQQLAQQLAALTVQRKKVADRLRVLSAAAPPPPMIEPADGGGGDDYSESWDDDGGGSYAGAYMIEEEEMPAHPAAKPKPPAVQPKPKPPVSTGPKPAQPATTVTIVQKFNALHPTLRLLILFALAAGAWYLWNGATKRRRYRAPAAAAVAS